MRNRTSDDVRRLIINMHNMGCPHPFIASAAAVTTRTVRAIVAQWKTTGVVRSILTSAPAAGRPRALGYDGAAFMRELMASMPTLYLDEIRDALIQNTGINVHVSTISRALKRYGITRKKVSRRAAERSPAKRDEYRVMVAGIPADYLVFIDESAIDCRSANRDMGYSLQGERAPQEVNFVRGDRYSILPALCLEGILAMDAIKGSYTAQSFRAFIERLLTEMNRYPGPNSVVVMDNCRIHKDPETLQMITDRGMHYIFLPPYSPDYNPIELAFAKVKKSLRRDGALARNVLSGRGPEAQAEIMGFLYKHVYSITPEDAQGWFEHCHYF